MANQHPAILVHGMFGWGPNELGGFPYWGTAALVDSPLRRHFASVGPISSAYDRACELAFQIRGGRVDYGAEHAAEAEHERFGRVHPGFHPDWSEAAPVHLIGHSMGGPTIWMLQHLLAQDAFGWGSSAAWVRSISTISGAMNGSTVVYWLGCDLHTGLLQADGIGAFLIKAVELYTAATGSLFDSFYDLDLDHWGYIRGRDESLADYLQRIADGPMFRGRDNGAYSVSLQGMCEQNQRCQTYPGSHYFSYVTQQTFSGFLTGFHLPHPRMNPFIIPSAVYIGSAGFEQPFYPGFNAAEWWPNDGLISAYSQAYPRSAGEHPSAAGVSDRCDYEPGVWYHELLDGVDHIDIVALPQLDQIGTQKRFYRALFERLATL